METAIIIILISTMNIVAFIVGAVIGQKTVKGENIKLPTINPISTIKEYEEKKEQHKEQQRVNTMFENIENYNGDGIGQKEVT